jgi:hypothetical protein
MHAGWEGAPSPGAGPSGGKGRLPSNWSALLPRLRHLRIAGCGAEGALPRGLVEGRALETLALPHNRLTEWPSG